MADSKSFQSHAFGLCLTGMSIRGKEATLVSLLCPSQKHLEFLDSGEQPNLSNASAYRLTSISHKLVRLIYNKWLGARNGRSSLFLLWYELSSAVQMASADETPAMSNESIVMTSKVLQKRSFKWPQPKLPWVELACEHIGIQYYMRLDKQAQKVDDYWFYQRLHLYNYCPQIRLTQPQRYVPAAAISTAKKLGQVTATKGRLQWECAYSAMCKTVLKISSNGGAGGASGATSGHWNFMDTLL